MLDPSRRTLIAMLGAAAIPARAWAQIDGPALVDLRTADGRSVQVTRWSARRRRGTILFSHGALSAPWKYDPLILPWVAAGYDVWAPLHVDSTDHPQTADYPGLASWAARVEDMRALAAHVGARRWIAAGHSYGALVALTLGGASPVRPGGVTGSLADDHVSCVVAFSPPGVGMGLIDAAGYATLAVPGLIQTGTLDIFPGAPPTAWRDHLAAYEAVPPGGDRYAMILAGADHYFGGLICRPDLPGPRQTAQMDAAVAISRLFLDGYGRSQRRARARLQAMDGQAGLVTLSRR